MPSSSPARAWLEAAAAALLLALASPPGAFQAAEWLVLPGLLLLYRVVTGAWRPAWRAYFAGAAYMAAMSWSLRHILFAAYVAVALLGGLYFAILPRWVRGLAALRVPRPLAFGLAVAGASWLRANMPEVWYPHGQPGHALYRWPALLSGPVAFGGEPLLHVLLGTVAALLAERGPPRRRGAWLGAIAVAWFGLNAGRLAWRGAATAASTIDVALIQPGLRPADFLLREAGALRIRQRERLVQPTLAVAGPDAADPPDLVLWPESTSFVDILGDAEGRRQVALADWWCAEPPLPLARATRLLVGGQIYSTMLTGTPVGILLDHRGRLLDHHEKLRLVPGGEHQPFLGWLPAAWSDALQKGLAQALGSAPHLTPGSLRAPFDLAPGVRAATLLCYDNAFPDVARQHIAAGANLLVILSNECWYRGGSELEQLEAMSVLRALETGAPILRCTVDGVTVALDAEGRALGRLAPAEAATLRIRLPVPPRAGPVAPAARAAAAACAFSLFLALAQGLWAWARLRRSC